MDLSVEQNLISFDLTKAEAGRRSLALCFVSRCLKGWKVNSLAF